MALYILQQCLLIYHSVLKSSKSNNTIAINPQINIKDVFILLCYNIALMIEFRNHTKQLNYGNHEIKTLHNAPIHTTDGVINICSKCISMFPTKKSLSNHMEKCTIPFVPFYEEQSFKISKIESLKTKQLLSMLSLLFIKSKTVYFEVENYDFYIVYDKEIIGYFSKYRNGSNSLNCFLVFPCFQKQGWGTILMDYSSAPVIGEEAKSPEKPYSKKAIFCFRKYWKYKVIGAKSISEIAKRENLTVDDAIIGLELNGFDFKKWKLSGEITVEKPRLLSKKIIRKS